ncbi:hypothetical protein C4569_00915 [Candidatus Parcubacteria bacterium]|nr:MAG: hypothetical protein C4569_00915 [Candidatus Parcubacteria bacterium]
MYNEIKINKSLFWSVFMAMFIAVCVMAINCGKARRTEYSSLLEKTVRIEKLLKQNQEDLKAMVVGLDERILALEEKVRTTDENQVKELQAIKENLVQVEKQQKKLGTELESISEKQLLEEAQIYFEGILATESNRSKQQCGNELSDAVHPDKISYGPAGLTRKAAEEIFQKVYGNFNDWEIDRILAEPEMNAAFGKMYFEKQVRRFKDPETATIAYHIGPTRLAKLLKKGEALPKEYLGQVKKNIQRLKECGQKEAMDQESGAIENYQVIIFMAPETEIAPKEGVCEEESEQDGVCEEDEQAKLWKQKYPFESGEAEKITDKEQKTVSKNEPGADSGYMAEDLKQPLFEDKGDADKIKKNYRPRKYERSSPFKGWSCCDKFKSLGRQPPKHLNCNPRR